MSDETDTRDRVIRMEVELEQVKKDVKAVDEKVDDVKKAVGEIKDLLTQAKGAQRAIQFLIWLSGTSIFVWVVTYSKSVLALFQGLK